MVHTPNPSAPSSASVAERDRGLERLRQLTIALVVGAVGLVLMLSFLAASIIPGRAAAPSASTGAQAGGASSQGTQAPAQQPQQQPQQPFGGFFGSGNTSGSPVAVSGGS